MGIYVDFMFNHVACSAFSPLPPSALPRMKENCVTFFNTCEVFPLTCHGNVTESQTALFRNPIFHLETDSDTEMYFLSGIVCWVCDVADGRWYGRES